MRTFHQGSKVKVPLLEAGYTEANLSLSKCINCLAKMEGTIYGLAIA